MTPEVILNLIKYLCFHDGSIHRNLYQNRFMNKSARNNFVKIPQSHSFSFQMYVEELTFLQN